ncbi:unnamed protein product [Somion occarium]|uniref:Mob1/phocein n=1 Tax=Somion occarium TaxID=3059160 RepID=A0ABP1DMQ2_9APHY
MVALLQRPLKGSRISSFYPVKSVPPLSSLDSAFQLQEYISLLIRADVHDVETIVSLPGGKSGERREGSDGSNGSEGDSDKDGRNDVPVDPACWVYEQLRRLAQDLSHPLITMLQQECTRSSCPEMKAGEWLYLCVAHGNDGATEQCCAIDYILHTLDSATALLNSPRAFPSRLSIPQASHRHFSSLARRLGRIFAHAYFHHREAFEQAEAESSLYARFLALTSKFDLVPSEFLVIPPRLSSMQDDDSRGRPLNLLDSHSYLRGDSSDQNGNRGWDLGDSSSIVNLSIGNEDRGPGPKGIGGGVSPLRKSRNRTGTMVHSDAFNVAEELSKVEEPTNPLQQAIDVAIAAEADAQDRVDAVLPTTEEPLQSQPEFRPPAQPELIQIEEAPPPEVPELSEVVDLLDIVAPPPAEPPIPPHVDDTSEDITDASLDDVPSIDPSDTGTDVEVQEESPLQNDDSEVIGVAVDVPSETLDVSATDLEEDSHPADTGEAPSEAEPEETEPEPVPTISEKKNEPQVAEAPVEEIEVKHPSATESEETPSSEVVADDPTPVQAADSQATGPLTSSEDSELDTVKDTSIEEL